VIGEEHGVSYAALKLTPPKARKVTDVLGSGKKDGGDPVISHNGPHALLSVPQHSSVIDADDLVGVRRTKWQSWGIANGLGLTVAVAHAVDSPSLDDW
jgi:hypothetical protein